MSVKPRRRVLARGDDQVLIYSALFLACALLNALAGAAIGVAAFLPAALAVVLLRRTGTDKFHHTV